MRSSEGISGSPAGGAPPSAPKYKDARVPSRGRAKIRASRGHSLRFGHRARSRASVFLGEHRPNGLYNWFGENRSGRARCRERSPANSSVLALRLIVTFQQVFIRNFLFQSFLFEDTRWNVLPKGLFTVGLWGAVSLLLVVVVLKEFLEELQHFFIRRFP